jgi:ABC-2 type transport system permease protein
METLVDRPAPQDVRRPGADRNKKPGIAEPTQQLPSRVALFRDLAAAFSAPGFWLYGAWIDTSLQYRSQVLGAFWMVAGTLVFVIFVGSLFSNVLEREDSTYFTYLASGYVLFTFMSQCLLQSTRVFASNRAMIQTGYIKYANYVLRFFCAQLINLAYNLLVVVGAIALTPVTLTAAALILVVTVPLFMVAILGVSVLFSVIGARYADFGELVKTGLQLGFFLTPIIWVPSASGKGALIGAFLYANPFYYLLEVVRAPLVNGRVPWFEIGIVAAAIPLIWLLAGIAYARAKPYLPLWI